MTAFRTISMRIRGYDEETEEYIGNVEELTGKIADLTKTAKTPGGISLFTDANKTEYKSTYQLLKDISEIWDELTDKNQAALLEALAGKRGGQVLAGILSPENFSEVDRALQQMTDAAGAADDEMAIIEQSLDYKINRLRETWVGTFQAIIDRGQLGQIVDGLTGVSEALGFVIDKVGLLNLGGFGLEGLLMSKGLGFVGYDKQKDNGESIISGIYSPFLDFFKSPEIKSFNDDTEQFLNVLSHFDGDKDALNELINGFDDLDKGIAQSASDMFDAGQAGDEIAESLRNAGEQGGKLGAVLKSLGSIVINMGITLAIEAVIGLLHSFATYEDEVSKKAQKTGSELKATEEDIDSYKSKITELQKTINDSSTSYEDAREARKQLFDVQKELVSKYGTEEDSIRSVTDAINGQVDALDNLKNAEYKKILSEFNRSDFDTFIKNPGHETVNYLKRLVYGLGDGRDFNDTYSNSEVLQWDMSRALSEFRLSNKDLEIFKKNAKDFKYSIDNLGQVYSVGEIHDLKDDMSELYNTLEHSDMSAKGLRTISKEIERLNSDISDRGELSDYLIIKDSIYGTEENSNLNISNQYEAFVKNQEAYEQAVLNGYDNQAEDLAAHMSEIYQNVLSKYSVDNILSAEERQVLNFLKRQAPEVNLELAKFKTQLEKDLDIQPVIKANDIKIEAKESRVDDLTAYIRDEIDKATEMGIDLSNTVYGNIDTAVRDSLEWTDENLEKYHDAILSWGFTPEELKGSISTVLGSMDEFDGIDIAYSPMLETDHGLELLSRDTVNEYINRVLEAAGDDKSLENILKIDAEGFEVDGKRVKNLIADIGETAEQNNQSMHFTGLNGSIESAANEVAKLDSELNKLYNENESFAVGFESTLTGRLQNAIGMTDITVEKLNEIDAAAKEFGDEKLKNLGFSESEIKVYLTIRDILAEWGVGVSEATKSMHKMHIVSTDLQKQLRNSFNSKDVKDYINSLSQEDLTILLKADLDKDATLSKVKSVIEQGQLIANNMPIELNIVTKGQLSKTDITKSADAAFDALEAAYKERFDEEGNFVAGNLNWDTMASLSEQFENTDGLEHYIDVLSDVNSTEEDYRHAHEELLSEYLNSIHFYDQVTEENADYMESLLRSRDVVNAHELVVDALNHKIREQKAGTDAATLAEKYRIQEGKSLTEVVKEETEAGSEAEGQAYKNVFAFLEEKGASEETKAAIIDLILSQDAFSSSTIDITSKLNNLATLCEALGETELAAYAATAAIEAVGTAETKRRAGETPEDWMPSAGAGTAGKEVKYTTKDSAYRLATSKLKSNAKNRAARINGLKTDWGKAKNTALGSSGGKGGKGGSGSGGSGSSKDPTDQAKEDEKELEDTYDEFFDYFERRVKVVTDAISLLDAHLENVVGSKAKNRLLDAQERLYRMQQQEYAGAKEMYQQMADQALDKVPEQLRDKIKNGAVAIDEFINKGKAEGFDLENEEIVEALNNYTKWADKVSECTQKLAELKEELRQLELKRFKNIAQDWQDLFDLRQNNAIDLIDKQIDLFTEAGQLIGKNFYEEQKKQSEKQLDLLKNEREALVAELNRGLSNGTIEIGSDEWLEMRNVLSDLEGQILDCAKAIETFDNAILQLHVDVFERIQGQLDDFDDQLSDMATFLDDEKVSDKYGEWSQEGMARAGLLAQQFELANKKVRDYTAEIAWLNEQYKQGKYSTTEYMDRLADLMSAQRDAAQTADDMKDAMIDLNRDRVDIVIDGINEEIDAYQELIDAQKKALQAQKD